MQEEEEENVEEVKELCARLEAQSTFSSDTSSTFTALLDFAARTAGRDSVSLTEEALHGLFPVVCGLIFCSLAASSQASIGT